MKRSSVREVEGDWSDEDEPAKPSSAVQPAKVGFGIGRRRGLSNPAQVGRKAAEPKKVRLVGRRETAKERKKEGRGKSI